MGQNHFLDGLVERPVDWARCLSPRDVAVHSRGDGSRLRIAHVADDKINPCCKRRGPSVRTFGRAEREADVRVHGPIRREHDKERPFVAEAGLV